MSLMQLQTTHFVLFDVFSPKYILIKPIHSCTLLLLEEKLNHCGVISKSMLVFNLPSFMIIWWTFIFKVSWMFLCYKVSHDIWHLELTTDWIPSRRFKALIGVIIYCIPVLSTTIDFCLHQVNKCLWIMFKLSCPLLLLFYSILTQPYWI